MRGATAAEVGAPALLADETLTLALLSKDMDVLVEVMALAGALVEGGGALSTLDAPVEVSVLTAVRELLPRAPVEDGQEALKGCDVLEDCPWEEDGREEESPKEVRDKGSQDVDPPKELLSPVALRLLPTDPDPPPDADVGDAARQI